EQFRIMDPANLPMKPVKPDPMKIFVGGGIIGLFFGGGVVWLLDFQSIPFRKPEEVLAALDRPTFATIPFMSGLWGGELKPAVPAAPEQSRARRWLSWPLKLAGRLQARTAASPVKPVVQANLNALAAEQFRVL